MVSARTLTFSYFYTYLQIQTLGRRARVLAPLPLHGDMADMPQVVLGESSGLR
jgi:hypothetical protein